MKLLHLGRLLAPAFLGLALASACGAATLFTEDFESGSGLSDGKWSTIGNGTINNSGYNSTHALGFSAKGAGGDSWTLFITVSANTTYWISVDYKQTGAGGYLGIEQYTSGGADLGETWLWGDGGYASNAVFNGAGVVYHHYVQAFTTAATAGKLKIKLEDWTGNGTAVGKVFFDNLNMTNTNPASTTASRVQWKETVQ